LQAIKRLPSFAVSQQQPALPVCQPINAIADAANITAWPKPSLMGKNAFTAIVSATSTTTTISSNTCTLSTTNLLTADKTDKEGHEEPL
jgi:hypothetical protein